MSGPWLKTLTSFQLLQFPVLATEAFADALKSQQFTPCGTYDREQHGFIPAFGHEAFVRITGDYAWLQMKTERKVVPGSAVKRILKERVTEIEEREARKVSKKEKKELKEVVTDELLATALSNETVVSVMVDVVAKRLLISSGSNRVIEKVLELLLKSIPGLELQRVEFGDVVSKEMANLLLGGESSVFETDSSLMLRGPGAPAATIRFAQHNLAQTEIAAHINAGMRPVALELGWNSRVSFVLTETFGLQKIKFLEQVTGALEESLPEDPEELVDAVLLLQGGELSELLKDLAAWFAPEIE